MLTVKCQHCGKSFKAQRSTAKFCSPNCRVKSNAGPAPKKAKKAIRISSTKEKPEIKVSTEEAEVLRQLPQFKKEPPAVIPFGLQKALEYEEKTGMSILDLIEFHKKNRLKVVEAKEGRKSDPVKYNRFKIKMGAKE